MRGLVLVAAILQLCQGAPQYLLGHPYALPYALPSAAVVTGNSVPVSVGGYKAVAGSNGDLAGPVHKVPGLVPALATHKQENKGDVSLSTGTGALLRHPLVYYGKREAEADPQSDPIGTCTRSEVIHHYSLNMLGGWGRYHEICLLHTGCPQKCD